MTSLSVLRRENGGLSLQDKKEVIAVYDHAIYCQKTLQNLTEKFSKMGSLGLRWDSKVPKDGWFCHLFTFRASNKKEVLEEIEKYQKFYQWISEVTSQIMNDKDEEISQKDKDTCQLVSELWKHLGKLRSAAAAGKETTDSSTVYRLHREFIDKHEKLKSLIKNVHFVALKQSKERSTVIIENVKTDLKKSEDKVNVADDKIKQLVTEFKKVGNEKRTLEQVNDLMEEQNKQLLEKSNEQKERLEALNQERAEMAQRNQRLENRHEDVCDKFNQLFANHQEVRMDNGVMRGENNLLQERSLDQAEQIETLRRENRELNQRNERLEQERRDQFQAIDELKAQHRDLNALVLDLVNKMKEKERNINSNALVHRGI